MKSKLWLLAKAFSVLVLLTVLIFFTPEDQFQFWLYTVSIFFIAISLVIDIFELKKNKD